MARYGDLHSLRNRVKTETNPYGKPTLEYASGLKVLIMIDKEPTADVTEVKHGRWIKPAGMLKIFENKYVICSECNVMLPIITELNRYHYCPKCGAKMDGDDNA